MITTLDSSDNSRENAAGRSSQASEQATMCIASNTGSTRSWFGDNITAGDIADVYPCSPLQEGVLLSSTSYAVYWVWRCVPAVGRTVDVHRLKLAWLEAIRHHSIYSTLTRMHPENDTFVQIVLALPEITTVQIGTESSFPEMVLASRDRPNFAAHQPKHAFTICMSAGGNVACRLDICHTLFDAYSLRIILEDVLNVYDGRKVTTSPPFSDVVRYIQKNTQVDASDYWLDFLDGVRPTHLPASLPYSNVGSSDDQDFIEIPPQALSSVTGFCKERGITRSVFIHVAWALMLSYYTGSDDLCFGYMASGRDAPVSDIDRICGPMANLMVSRLNLKTTLESLMSSATAMLKTQRSYQQVSMAKVQHDLGVKGGRLFNTMVNLLRVNPPALDSRKSFTFEKYMLVSPHEVCEALALSAMMVLN